MHPRNKHAGKYPFNRLIKIEPELKQFIRSNPAGEQTIDFSNARAIKLLNKALLREFYNVEFWDIPDGHLCPPIPGRAEYIHAMSDLVIGCKNVRCLDIGTGASCIYPILGRASYQWDFVGSDIDPRSLKVASENVSRNPALQGHIELRLQTNSRDIFRGVIKDQEKFELSFCNPPFYSSAREAEEVTQKKAVKLGNESSRFNFGGKHHELACEGGEKKFIESMAFQSKFFKDSVLWFSTLVSQKEHLNGLYKTLKKVNALESKTMLMDLGNKKSRLVAWTFQSPESQKEWLAEKI